MKTLTNNKLILSDLRSLVPDLDTQVKAVYA